MFSQLYDRGQLIQRIIDFIKILHLCLSPSTITSFYKPWVHKRGAKGKAVLNLSENVAAQLSVLILGARAQVQAASKVSHLPRNRRQIIRLENEPERNLLSTYIKQSLKVYVLQEKEWKQSNPVHLQLTGHYKARDKPVCNHYCISWNLQASCQIFTVNKS